MNNFFRIFDLASCQCDQIACSLFGIYFNGFDQKKCQRSLKILQNTKTLIFFSKDLNLVTLLLDIPRLEWDSNPQKSFGGSLSTWQFLPKRDVFPNSFKVTKNLGFFCKKIYCQRLSKTNKSGHTDVLESILFLIFVSLHLRKDLWNN